MQSGEVSKAPRKTLAFYVFPLATADGEFLCVKNYTIFFHLFLRIKKFARISIAEIPTSFAGE